MTEETNIWDKIRTITTLIASVLIPLAVVLITQIYANSEAKQQQEARYVELAIEILRGEPQKETRAIRSWAIEIVSRYSPVKFSQSALDELKLAPIRDMLDGNKKGSTELIGDVEELMKNWKERSDSTEKTTQTDKP